MKKLVVVACLLGCAFSAAHAERSVLVALEPTARKDGLLVSRVGLEANVGKLLGQKIAVTSTDDLTDAMRATRAGDYDIFIAPAQVAASAINHGYELVGSTDDVDHYVLVGRSGLNSVADIRKGRIYLPQQDSIYTYLARGLLTSAGLSFKDLNKVEFALYPQAGLTALTMKMTDATVIRSDEWERWQKDNPGQAKALATSGTVPGGLSVVIKKSLPDDEREKLTKWFTTSSRAAGLKTCGQHAELKDYKKVAELGTFTPAKLPGATVVTATEVMQLQSAGAVVVDTRSEKEYKAKHIPGAVFVPYHEKSLKDVAYDGTLDDFSGLKSLKPQAPTIFHCNGAECWKSYKASRAAMAAGFSKVYWYRGGMPDWESAGQKLASN